jgi:flagellar biosynthesis/type III secretory pathway protein FliH
LSKHIVRGNSTAKSFEQSVVALSELPPPDQRKGNRIAEVIRKQKEEVRQKAFAEGYEQGFAQGRSEGYEEGKNEADTRYGLEIGSFVDRLRQAESEFEGVIAAWLGQAEEQLAALAVIIAERVLRSELQSSRESVLGIAKDAVSEVRHGTSVRIRVNPFDSTLVEGRSAEIMAACAGLRSIEVVSDPAIAGGCVIESAGGLVDARIDHALERIVAATKAQRAGLEREDLPTAVSHLESLLEDEILEEREAA